MKPQTASFLDLESVIALFLKVKLRLVYWIYNSFTKGFIFLYTFFSISLMQYSLNSNKLWYENLLTDGNLISYSHSSIGKTCNPSSMSWSNICLTFHEISSSLTSQESLELYSHNIIIVSFQGFQRQECYRLQLQEENMLEKILPLPVHLCLYLQKEDDWYPLTAVTSSLLPIQPLDLLYDCQLSSSF